jgi:hypothetical protein
VAGTAILWANVGAMLANRVGVKPVLLVGMSLLGVGLLWFTQISVDGSYWTDLFPGFLLIGIGMPFVFVPVTIAAVAGVSHDEAGLASGLINTSQQIGGALGIAVLSAIANSVTSTAVEDGTAKPTALVDGGERSGTGRRVLRRVLVRRRDRCRGRRRDRRLRPPERAGAQGGARTRSVVATSPGSSADRPATPAPTAPVRLAGC